MAGSWFSGLFARLRRRKVSVKDRFVCFQAICAENDAFLREMSRLLDVADGAEPVATGTARLGYRALSGSIGMMVETLNAMSYGRYRPLHQRFEALKMEAAAEVLEGTAGDVAAMPFVLWPGEQGSARLATVGGKGANLCRLAQGAGVEVPPFFVVTRRGYDEFMDQSGAAAQAKQLFRRTAAEDEGSLRARCEALCGLIRDAELPVALSVAIGEAYDRLSAGHPLPHGVAVRSSAVMEDSDSSFAGQFATVLGVTRADLASAYREVVASKYRCEAVRYARLTGFADDDLAMPVVVMPMVQPVVSGVVYSRDPDSDAVLITAVPGLAEAAVDGRVIPERVLAERKSPFAEIERTAAGPGVTLRCREGGGIIEETRAAAGGAGPLPSVLPSATVAALAALALELEAYFGRPQDIEWAQSDGGTLYVVQSRPLNLLQAGEQRDSLVGAETARVLVPACTRASGGVAAGRVQRIASIDDLDAVQQDAVLVVPTTSPKLAAIMDKVSAIVAETGSPTGHMAAVARELGVPALVGAATEALVDGALVTVDAWAAEVYEGEVPKLLAAASRRTKGAMSAGPGRIRLQLLLDRVTPLTLKDPRSPEFTIEACQSFHDVARFVHQHAMTEIFQMDLSPSERTDVRRLRWAIPMEVLILDLGGGLAEGTGRSVQVEQIASRPFRVLLEGMTDPRIQWSGPVGFDLKGFVSVVVRSAADDQRYGEPNFAFCGTDYVQLNARLAYHFCSVDAMSTSAANQNYVRFAFFGGAAVAERREHRAHFLATVLRAHGFEVTRQGDRVEAILGKRDAPAIDEALLTVGRLLAAARHLDMLMESRSTAEAYAEAFLAGDFGFAFVREAQP